MVNEETQLQRQIMLKVSELGAIPYRMQVGKFYTKNLTLINIGIVGTPDLLIIMPNGKNIWLEIKTPKGKRSKEQIAFHEILKSYNQHVYTVNSVEQVEEIYKKEIKNDN